MGRRARRAVPAALPPPALLLLLERRRRCRGAADGAATDEHRGRTEHAKHLLWRAGQARRKSDRREEVC